MFFESKKESVKPVNFNPVTEEEKSRLRLNALKGLITDEEILEVIGGPFYRKRRLEEGAKQFLSAKLSCYGSSYPGEEAGKRPTASGNASDSKTAGPSYRRRS